jgi:hypothetical protein
MLVRITSWKGRNLQYKFYKITTTFYLSYPTRYDYNRTVYMYILTLSISGVVVWAMAQTVATRRAVPRSRAAAVADGFEAISDFPYV